MKKKLMIKPSHNGRVYPKSVLENAIKKLSDNEKNMGKLTHPCKNESIDLVSKIAQNTIGFDLTTVEPMSKEETEQWLKENERANKEYKEKHKDFYNKYGNQKPYTLTPEEREIVKEVLKMSDERLDTMEIGIHEDGDINVKTPRSSWLSLDGREWWVNLKEKTCKCVALS